MYEEQFYYNNNDEKVEPHRTHCEPLNVHCLLTGMDSIRHYALDMEYVPPPGPQATMKKFKNRLYGVLITMNTMSNGTSELWIARKYPGIAWQPVWANVHTTGFSDTIKSIWYSAIHEIIPTNER